MSPVSPQHRCAVARHHHRAGLNPQLPLPSCQRGGHGGWGACRKGGESAFVGSGYAPSPGFSHNEYRPLRSKGFPFSPFAICVDLLPGGPQDNRVCGFLVL